MDPLPLNFFGWMDPLEIRSLSLPSWWYLARQQSFPYPYFCFRRQDSHLPLRLSPSFSACCLAHVLRARHDFTVFKQQYEILISAPDCYFAEAGSYWDFQLIMEDSPGLFRFESDGSLWGCGNLGCLHRSWAHNLDSVFILPQAHRIHEIQCSNNPFL